MNRGERVRAAITATGDTAVLMEAPEDEEDEDEATSSAAALCLRYPWTLMGVLVLLVLYVACGSSDGGGDIGGPLVPSETT